MRVRVPREALVLATVANANRPSSARYARWLQGAIECCARRVLRWMQALTLADAPVENARLPALPADCVRMIYARKWRAEAHDRAACVVQRAVRRAIKRAQGDPWDLPALIENDAFHALCFGTLLVLSPDSPRAGRIMGPTAGRTGMGITMGGPE